MRPFAPKDLMDRLIGRDIWNMCELFEDTFHNKEERALIKKGLKSTFIRFALLGVLFGIALTLTVFPLGMLL